MKIYIKPIAIIAGVAIISSFGYLLRDFSLFHGYAVGAWVGFALMILPPLTLMGWAGWKAFKKITQWRSRDDSNEDGLTIKKPLRKKPVYIALNPIESFVYLNLFIFVLVFTGVWCIFFGIDWTEGVGFLDHNRKFFWGAVFGISIALTIVANLFAQKREVKRGNAVPIALIGMFIWLVLSAGKHRVPGKPILEPYALSPANTIPGTFEESDPGSFPTGPISLDIPDENIGGALQSNSRNKIVVKFTLSTPVEIVNQAKRFDAVRIVEDVQDGFRATTRLIVSAFADEDLPDLPSSIAQLTAGARIYFVSTRRDVGNTILAGQIIRDDVSGDPIIGIDLSGGDHNDEFAALTLRETLAGGSRFMLDAARKKGSDDDSTIQVHSVCFADKIFEVLGRNGLWLAGAPLIGDVVLPQEITDANAQVRAEVAERRSALKNALTAIEVADTLGAVMDRREAAMLEIARDPKSGVKYIYLGGPQSARGLINLGDAA